MRIVRLAELFANKYKIAINAVDLESSLRRKLEILWNYPNRQFSILKSCADSGVSNAKTPEERKVYAGYKFCKDLLSEIDYLHKNALNIDVVELKQRLEKIIGLITANKDMKFSPGGIPSEQGKGSSVQFPHVAELIYHIFPIGKKYEKKLRDDMQGKARTGLSRILSFSISLLEDLDKLEMMDPERFAHQADVEEPKLERFTPQRTQLSVYDVVDFLRQHGAEYGISSTDDWGKLFLDDPVLRNEMTTVVNAVNRGHYPRGAEQVKAEIDDILRRHKERKAASNAHLFEEPEFETAE